MALPFFIFFSCEEVNHQLLNQSWRLPSFILFYFYILIVILPAFLPPLITHPLGLIILHRQTLIVIRSFDLSLNLKLHLILLNWFSNYLFLSLDQLTHEMGTQYDHHALCILLTDWYLFLKFKQSKGSISSALR